MGSVVKTIQYKSPEGKVVNIPDTPRQRKLFERKGYKPLAPRKSKRRHKTSSPSPSSSKPKKVSVVVRSRKGDYETFQNITLERLKELQTKYGYTIIKKVEGRAIKGSEVNKAISEAHKKVSVVVRSKKGDYETFQNISAAELKRLQQKYGYTVIKKVEGRAIKGSEVNKAIHQDIGKIEILEGKKPAILYYSKAQFKGKTPEQIVEEVNRRRQAEATLKSLYKKIKSGKDVVIKTPSGQTTTLRAAGLSGVSVKTLEKRGYKFINPKNVKFVDGKIVVEEIISKPTRKVKPQQIEVPSLEERVWKETKLSSTEKKLSPFFGGYTPYFFGSGISKEEIAQEMLYSGQRTMTQKETERALKIQIKSIKASQEQEKAFERWGIAKSTKGSGVKYHLAEFGKGVARGIVTIPESIISTPIFAYQLATQPKQTADRIVKEFTTNPAGFIGEIAGTIIVFEGVRLGVRGIRGSLKNVKVSSVTKSGTKKLNIENIEATNLRTVKLSENTAISSGKIKLKLKGLDKAVEGKVRIISKGDKAKLVVKINEQKIGGVKIKAQEIIVGEKKLMEGIRRGDIILEGKGKVVYPYEAKGISMRAEKRIGIGESPYRSGLKTKIGRIGYRERGIVTRTSQGATVESVGIVRVRGKPVGYLTRERIIDMPRILGDNIVRDSVAKLTGKEMIKPKSGAIRSLAGKSVKVERIGLKPRASINTGNLGRIIGESIVRSTIASLTGISKVTETRQKRLGTTGIRMKRIEPRQGIMPLKAQADSILQSFKTTGISLINSYVPVRIPVKMNTYIQGMSQSIVSSLTEAAQPLIRTTPTPIRKPPVKLRKKRIAPVIPPSVGFNLGGVMDQLNTTLKMINHRMAKLTSLL